MEPLSDTIDLDEVLEQLQCVFGIAALCRAYFENKGMHVQFNVIDKATLVEAQKHPEQHKDLVVRVAGYSAQFISLAKEVQDNIIDRTEFEF